MKLKYEFVIEEVAGQKIAVAVGEETKKSGFIKLNNTGAYIMKMLQNDVSTEDVVSAIQTDFEVENVNQVKEAVVQFIDNLKKADLID